MHDFARPKDGTAGPDADARTGVLRSDESETPSVPSPPTRSHSLRVNPRDSTEWRIREPEPGEFTQAAKSGHFHSRQSASSSQAPRQDTDSVHTVRGSTHPIPRTHNHAKATTLGSGPDSTVMHAISEHEIAVGDQRVPIVDKEELVRLMNGDLSREYQAIITYIQYAASVTGPYRQELKEFFEKEIPDELRHARYLADKIATFGEVPTVEPETVLPETEARRMLENIFEAERTARNAFSARTAQAEALGEVGLSNHLQQFADDEAHHLDETLKMLRGWPQEQPTILESGEQLV